MTSQKDQTYTNIPTFKILLWLSMVSMVMMFAGLTSGYIVRQAEGNWFQFELPPIFYISTRIYCSEQFEYVRAIMGVKKTIWVNSHLADDNVRTWARLYLHTIRSLVETGGFRRVLYRKPIRIISLCSQRFTLPTLLEACCILWLLQHVQYRKNITRIITFRWSYVPSSGIFWMVYGSTSSSLLVVHSIKTLFRLKLLKELLH